MLLGVALDDFGHPVEFIVSPPADTDFSLGSIKFRWKSRTAVRRELLLRQESGRDLHHKYPLVCKVLVGRGWFNHCRIPAAVYTL